MSTSYQDDERTFDYCFIENGNCYLSLINCFIIPLRTVRGNEQERHRNFPQLHQGIVYFSHIESIQ